MTSCNLIQRGNVLGGFPQIQDWMTFAAVSSDFAFRVPGPSVMRSTVVDLEAVFQWTLVKLLVEAGIEKDIDGNKTNDANQVAIIHWPLLVSSPLMTSSFQACSNDDESNNWLRSHLSHLSSQRDWHIKSKESSIISISLFTAL